MSTPSLTTTSVATESERGPSDTNIGWAVTIVEVESFFFFLVTLPWVTTGRAGASWNTSQTRLDPKRYLNSFFSIPTGLLNLRA